MNKILDYNVSGQSIEWAAEATLVAGTVNEYTARFVFDADWDGYQRIAVFAVDGVEREQLLTDDACDVPWEVLLSGARLKVGVYGTRDGKRLPTIWTSHRQYIHDGAGPTDEAADPSPVLAEQILQRMGDLGELKTEDKSSLVAAINEVKETGGGGGTADHAKLKNRDAADQHPISAITGLDDTLAGKQPTGDYLTKEQDPTVPDWAKQPQKPAYTAQEVGALPATTHIPSTAAEVNAEPSGAVAQHNVSDAAHNDIRLLIQGLSERLSALADSDDTTLDQMSEVVAYIKSNRDLISAITTSKVNVADIVDNLTTNVANKPLSAAQGVALKALIDALTEAMPEPYTLPIASETTLGGVKPVAKTDEMTQSVGVDEAGALWTAPGGSGGSGGESSGEYSSTVLATGVIPSGTEAGVTHTGVTFDQLNDYKIIYISRYNPTSDFGSIWSILHGADTTAWKKIVMGNDRGFLILFKVTGSKWLYAYRNKANVTMKFVFGQYNPFLYNAQSYGFGSGGLDFEKSAGIEICLHNDATLTADCTWTIEGIKY